MIDKWINEETPSLVVAKSYWTKDNFETVVIPVFLFLFGFIYMVLFRDDWKGDS